MKEVLAGLGTAIGLVIAGFVIQLLREQVKHIKDERLRKLAEETVDGLEQAISTPGQGKIKLALASQILQSRLGIPKEVAKLLATVAPGEEPTWIKGHDERVRDEHLLAIEAAVHRMKQQEDK